MAKITKHPEEANPLAFLKKFTEARVAVGTTGASIPAKALLDFNLAHAHARDAVYSTMNIDQLNADIENLGLHTVTLRSCVADRVQYLQRPDLGRKLHPDSLKALDGQVTGADVAIVIADGLSALAIDDNAAGLLKLLIPKLHDSNLTLSTISLVQQGRVAIGDDIGFALKAKLVIVLIGERPGLSAVNSMGIYLTYQPKPGLTDDSRNCISNIRPGGMSYEQAADKLFYLITASFRRKLSGVNLKDDASDKLLD